MIQAGFCFFYRRGLALVVILVALAGCYDPPAVHTDAEPPFPEPLAQMIVEDSLFAEVKDRARSIIRDGFNAGDGYEEVWIRDLNTFISLSLEEVPHDLVRAQLTVFLEYQGQDGNIADGFMPEDLRLHKNTVETDQETSLVQAVKKYVEKTGDVAFLTEEVNGISVLDRLEDALEFVLNERWSEEYGLVWGATTADWGDVQPEHSWGVHLDENSHLAVDIYDNAMLIIAIQDFLWLAGEHSARREYWNQVVETVSANIRQYLWKEDRFIPHIYLDGSPWPPGFNEEEIYYHGGTAVAILAGLLSREESFQSLAIMRDNVARAGAATIGLTLYPAYPEGFFLNPGMGPYSYQNGGDWTWFGGRMILALIEQGWYEEAYVELQPMLQRVQDNAGFFEWYTVENEPRGSGVFRGSAGVLYEAMIQLETLAMERIHDQ